MKKLLFSLFFICLFAFPVFADFTVDAVDVSATISVDGKTQVTDTITLTFRETEKSVTIPLPDGELGSISAGDYRFKVQKTDEGTNVVISSSSGLAGTQTFQISYTLNNTFKRTEESDTYTIHMLSSRWAKEIGSCSYQIVLPGAYAQPEDPALDFEPTVEIISGYYGSLSKGESRMDFSGNVITGQVQNRMSYDSLSGKITLPPGYFYVRQATLAVVSFTWLALFMAVLLLLSMIYWYLRVRTPKKPVSARILAPEGLLPCQLPQALDGRTCDIPALILEWANLGYLSFRTTAKGQLVLVQNMVMGSERSRAEQRLFRSIFGSAPRVLATPGRYSGSAARFRATMQKQFSRAAFDRKGGNIVLVQLPCQILFGIGWGAMVSRMLPEGAGFVVISVLAGMIGFVYAAMLHRHLSTALSIHRDLPKTALFCLGSLLMLILSLFFGAIIEMLIGTAACVISSLATASGPRRNVHGQELLAQTKGCRRFYRQVPWNRLHIYHSRNSRFFQGHFPRAAALKTDRSFARRFEHLSIPRPDWLLSSNQKPLSAATLQKQLSRLLRQLQEAFR